MILKQQEQPLVLPLTVLAVVPFEEFKKKTKVISLTAIVVIYTKQRHRHFPQKKIYIVHDDTSPLRDSYWNIILKYLWFIWAYFGFSAIFLSQGFPASCYFESGKLPSFTSFYASCHYDTGVINLFILYAKQSTTKLPVISSLESPSEIWSHMIL